MKKLLLLLIIALPGLCLSQVNSAQGGKGGVLVPASAQSVLSFEIVDNGSSVSFFPMDGSGNAPEVVPANVEVTVVSLSTTEQHTEKDVAFKNGAFTVYPVRQYPAYMYSISYTLNGQQYAMKHRLQNAPKPR
jgi:hypothetical protein